MEFEHFDKVSSTHCPRNDNDADMREWRACQGHHWQEWAAARTISSKRDVKSEARLQQQNSRVESSASGCLDSLLLHTLENIKALIKHQIRGHGGIRAGTLEMNNCGGGGRAMN